MEVVEGMEGIITVAGATTAVEEAVIMAAAVVPMVVTEEEAIMVEEARMGHLHRLPSMGHHLEVEEDLAEVVEEVVSAQISKREIGSAQTVGTTFLPETVRVEGVEHPRT